MMPAKLGTEVDSDYSSLSESSSMSSGSSSSSCYQNEDISNGGGRELKRKVKKLRSIKLARLPSLKLITRQSKVKSGDVSVLSSDVASSHHSRMSPNYMMTTTSSNAKKENLQKSARTLARRSSFKPAKSLTRLSSTKFRRPLMRISPGGTDLKKKLKKSRSIKIANRSSMVLASDADIPPDFSKAMNRLDGRNVQLQASLHNFESALGGNDDNRKILRNSKPKLASPGNNSMRVMTRTSTMRPVRILTKVASIRTKRPSMKKRSGIQKATCSSAIKDSKFPYHLELQPEGRESEGNSAMEVCPYSYCSLHGHHHSDVPPLKRFVSIRRRLLRNQKSMKSESRSSRRVKRSGNVKKGTRTSQLASCGDSAVLETSHDKIAVSSSIGKTAGPRSESTKEGAHGGDDKDTSNVISVTDIQILQQEAGEGRIENLNLDVLKIDSHSNTAKADASTSVAGEQLNKASRLNQNRVAESRDINNMVSFASIGKPLQEETAASEENNQDVVQNYQFPSADSEHGYAIDVSHETQKEKQKHMGLWNLLYQHMATGIATENGARPPLNKKTKEEEKDENTLPGINKSGSFRDFSSTDQSNDEEDHDEHGGKIHQYQCNAIKLVQEAFDRILAEIPDQSSDDQSIASDTSDKELAVKDQSEDGQSSILTSYDSDGDSIVQEPEELRLKADNAFEREKAHSRVESKSNQQMPKNWSNLKKILILKRFVKALEKVRNFNPQKARFLHAEAELGSEKVHLRHQTLEERKNSEEWMLDHALQQVISTLAPAQKRKVALLVRAFETITPLNEVGTSPRFNIEASSHTTPVKTCNGASDCNESIEGKETIFGITLRKTSSLDTIASTTSSLENTVADLKNQFVALNLGNGETNSIIKDNEPDFVNHCLFEDTETKLCDRPLPNTDDALRTSTEELVINGEVLPEDAKGGRSVSASEVYDRDFGLSSQNSDTNNQNNRIYDESDEPDGQTPKDNEGSTAITKVVSSSTISEPVEESSEVAGEENKLKNKFLQGSTLLHESEPGCTTDVAHEKQKHAKFWFLIYKHIVSGNATLIEGADKEEQGDDGNTLVGMKTSRNDDADNQKIKLQQMEAIRLVEEAIDQIPLPEIQDDAPDYQSVASDITQDQDQEYIEKKPEEGEKPFISSSFERTSDSFGESDSTEAEESTTLYQQESQLDFDNINAQEKTRPIPTEGNKPKPAVQKNWSNLKKVVLLKRFVKALEKVKKFNQQEPRFLPLDPLSEAEKVRLRHQDTDDRKNADEWMLDYALRQVVAKLTPARKRKVSLLVEAFEAVTPIGSGEWSDT
ncbi:calmodulin binding protein PICBP-like [Populus nigra]|uniref:calmodulin binding protein PICBP-like n=1 Tax=Populus nigra TaxID=3691 RepID=UPI002B272575|nr:calmodulin binding protein PICBP-like [Populus nigra]XP_061955017.1 calmodulin binding protein PICBP-like [Populus nigra]